MQRFWPGLLCTASLLLAASGLDLISADSLRKNVTWLAADERQGRMTPSPGLSASAEYIATQFRLAGLVPAGERGTFFQTATLQQITPDNAGFQMTLSAGGRKIALQPESVGVSSIRSLQFQDVGTVRVRGPGPLPSMTGRVVVASDAWEAPAMFHSLELRKPALILLVMGGEKSADANTLLDAQAAKVPVVRVYGRAASDLLAASGEMRLTLRMTAPASRSVQVRNVAGLLVGDDIDVRDQYVIVSAHYDHLGVKPPGPGNRIFHGANDDASGVASLIEIAKALKGETPRPRRSVLFLALFGEEEGMLGSDYYVRHPLVPLRDTIADINLEQLGRTDSSDGAEVGRFAFTGPSFSNLPQKMASSAKTAGVAVYRKESADDYFDRSDNYAFAEAGIVAHTVVVAFEYPGYHEVNDTADQLDYRNLAKVDRALAAGIEGVANAAEKPKWADTVATAIYRNAAR